MLLFKLKTKKEIQPRRYTFELNYTMAYLISPDESMKEGFRL